MNWSLPQEASQALDLLQKWALMDVTDALELLSPVYTHPTVRKYAVARLQPADDEVDFFKTFCYGFSCNQYHRFIVRFPIGMDFLFITFLLQER